MSGYTLELKKRIKPRFWVAILLDQNGRMVVETTRRTVWGAKVWARGEARRHAFKGEHRTYEVRS